LLRLEEWMDIKSLHKESHSIKAIARQTGRSRNTVRRVLREFAPATFHKPERHSGITRVEMLNVEKTVCSSASVPMRRATGETWSSSAD